LLLLFTSFVPALAGEHWAFQPATKVAVPAVRDTTWTKTPIDRFILAQLESVALKPSVPVRPELLVRRMSLGLLGLPPSPEEVEAFTNDHSPGADERLIDRLLASPHYGERWARHWLDLARYAESDGFEHDAVRPHSWRYRDYVVATFNSDKPYDQFIREQLAGDELAPGEPSALVATGFNLLGPDMVDSADQIQRRINTLNDMTDTVSSVFLGLTLGCARCHDHKSEPFTQRDYFSMQAFFAGAQFRREQPVPTEGERARHDRAKADYDALTLPQRKQIEDIEAPYRKKLFDEKLSMLSEDVQIAHRTPKEQRTMEQEGTVQETAPQVNVTDAEVTKALSKEDKSRLTAIAAQLRKIPKPASLPMAMVLHNTNSSAKTWVLARGDYNNPREQVQPDFPAVLVANRSSSATAAKSQRAAFAEWVASTNNSLTARVMVNRIWQHHFGRGLVASPSDFGTRGQPPTHPWLLDWLAGEFVRSGWRVKHMHKLIMLSSAYQQSSEPRHEALARDPENKLFSRQNRVRLEGEALRDSLLAISGRLNSHMGGPGVSPPIPADIAATAKNWTASARSADHHRRSIYVFARRNLRFPFLEVFDAPDSNLSCPERGRSTTAPQSLTLLNSEEVMAAARATADGVRNAAASASDRIDFAFRLILCREPTAQELALAQDFIKTNYRRDKPMDANSAEGDYSELCRALFNLNAFVYTE